jgi:hypothetical protein
MRDAIVEQLARFGRHLDAGRLVGGRSRCRGGSRRGGCGLGLVVRRLRSGAALGAFDIGLDDAAVRAAAGHGRKIDALFGGEALGKGRCDNASILGLAWVRVRPLWEQALSFGLALFAGAGADRSSLRLRRACLGCYRLGWRRWTRRHRPPSVAITVPTFTLSVPSGTAIEAITPSSTASNSMVALSVSISARMSPETTSSPSFTSHLASLPSSMVGERAGILISVGMDCSAFLNYSTRSPIDNPALAGKRQHESVGLHASAL